MSSIHLSDWEWHLNGGYDDGYCQCPCFWGKSPGSLVHHFLSKARSAKNLHVLDLGCGEGKNSHAFACAGARVIAVDCSEAALKNGQREFAHRNIDWIRSDAETYLQNCGEFDVVVMYGILHCLPSVDSIVAVVQLALRKTRLNGHHIVVSFNDGPHDLAAHPGFVPTLAPHNFYLDLYRDHQVLLERTDVIHEAHPHNEIPHFHSLTRLMARKLR